MHLGSENHFYTLFRKKRLRWVRLGNWSVAFGGLDPRHWRVRKAGERKRKRGGNCNIKGGSRRFSQDSSGRVYVNDTSRVWVKRKNGERHYQRFRALLCNACIAAWSRRTYVYPAEKADRSRRPFFNERISVRASAVSLSASRAHSHRGDISIVRRRAVGNFVPIALIKAKLGTKIRVPRFLISLHFVDSALSCFDVLPVELTLERVVFVQWAEKCHTWSIYGIFK